MEPHTFQAPLIPEPSAYRRISGRHSLLPQTRIVTAPEFQGVAGYLQSALSSATGWPFEISVDKNAEEILQDPHSQHVIVIALQTGTASEESYRLQIGWTAIRIQAAQPAGAFYAVQTLFQLLPPAVHQKTVRLDVDWALSCVDVEDSPRFRWRGAMLDSARYFQPVSFIRKFIDLLALHKLNVFHWHLTDDQGWRIEIQKYPRLTEIGSHRRESCRGHLIYNAGGDGVPQKGFYTQEEIRDLVTYAAERFVTIVPEIEMPGHAQAAIAAYPELGCVETLVEVSTIWGIHENILNPGEGTITFLQNVLGEVIELFPSKYIHIGGDEVKKNQWQSSPAVKERMAELFFENYSHLQSYFLSRIATFLARHGRRVVGWDEILEGETPSDAIVMSWRGSEGGRLAANAGHDVVMSPTDSTYLDSYQSLDTSQEPLAIGAYLPLEKVYAFEPVPPGVSSGNISHILGLQGQLWTEYMPTSSQVEYMTFPRLSALAEVAWSPTERRDFASFKRRLSLFLKRLDILETRYRPLDSGLSTNG